jgi:hypothetical protein
MTPVVFTAAGAVLGAAFAMAALSYVMWRDWSKGV